MIFGLQLGHDALSTFIYIIFSVVAIYLAIIPHEIAHGLVALWNGDPTAKEAGRLTMNPLKHFDAIGFTMMVMMGFGYAKPVPVNSYNFEHRKRGLFLVSIAGVVTNLIIAFIAALLYKLMLLGYATAQTAEGGMTFSYFATFFRLLLTVNLSLAFFNILPIYPLDGYRMIEAFAGEYSGYSRFMRANGRYILWGMVGLSFIISYASRFVELPYWFAYVDILGLYLNFFVGNTAWLFTSFWGLMIPGGV